MSASITDTQTTDTRTVPGSLVAEQFLVEAERIRSLAAGQLILTQSRCVDYLLDLLNLTAEPAVRAVLERCLSDIRHRSAVEGRALERAVALAVAALHVERSYDDLIVSSELL
jgi:hypothetical protein